MVKNDSKVLLTIDDRSLAEEIQQLLEESGIFSVLISDNPVSSLMNAYMGSTPSEKIDILLNVLDYRKAVSILSGSPYSDLIEPA